MNRLGVIDEQMKKYSEVRTAVENSYATLTKDFANLQLKKRHSTIRTETFMEELKDIKDRFLSPVCHNG